MVKQGLFVVGKRACGAHLDGEQPFSFLAFTVSQHTTRTNQPHQSGIPSYFSMADAFKDRGNECYKTGDFQGAIREYTGGLKLDPRHAVLLNNRAACYLALKRYTEAESDARASISSNATAKAYNRLGRSLFMTGQYNSALDAYKMAVQLDPTPAYQESVREVETVIGRGTTAPPASDDTVYGGGASPTQTGTGGSGGLMRTGALLMNIGVLVAAVLHLVFMIFAPPLSVTMWTGALAMMATRNVLGVLRGPEQPRLSFTYLKGLVTSQIATFSGQYFLLCVVFLLTGANPSYMMLISLAIYCGIDVVVNFRNDLRELLTSNGRAGPGAVGARLFHSVEPLMAKVASRQEEVFLQAAVLEVYQGILAPLSGLSIMHMMIYWQFLRQRYRTDVRCSRRAFSLTHMKIREWLTKPIVPVVVCSMFDKLAAGMHSLGKA